MPDPTGNILLLDGHGSTLANTFKWQRTSANRINLYSYTYQGNPIDEDASNDAVKTALSTRLIPPGFVSCQCSTDGGTIRERRLSAPRIDDGQVQWKYDVPSSWGADTLPLDAADGGGKANLVVWYDGASLKTSKFVLMHPQGKEGGGNRVLLSTILAHFDWQPFDVLWLVCRSNR